MCVLSDTAKMIGLPQVFWHEHGIGGGVIQVRHIAYCAHVHALSHTENFCRCLYRNSDVSEILTC